MITQKSNQEPQSLNAQPTPIVYIPTMSYEIGAPKSPELISFDSHARCLVASINKSGTDFAVSLLRNNPVPLFRVARKNVVEVVMEQRLIYPRHIADYHYHCAITQFENVLVADPEQWVWFLHPGSLVIRNIEHLIPSEPKGKPGMDFLYFFDQPSGQVSFGLWAVRGKYLNTVLEAWRKRLMELRTSYEFVSQEWTRFVLSLPLRTKQFERGEIVQPNIDTIDWRKLSNAALITLPGWECREQEQFLQALYFLYYLGDDSGLIINVLEP